MNIERDICIPEVTCCFLVLHFNKAWNLNGLGLPVADCWVYYGMILCGSYQEVKVLV